MNNPLAAVLIVLAVVCAAVLALAYALDVEAASTEEDY